MLYGRRELIRHIFNIKINVVRNLFNEHLSIGSSNLSMYKKERPGKYNGIQEHLRGHVRSKIEQKHLFVSGEERTEENSPI